MASSLALEGLKVADFSMFAAGPMVAKHLGEQGAQVIHVESRARPDGFRVHYPPYKDNQPGLDRTGSFALFNDSKYGVTLNLKTARGVEIAKKIVAWADVFVENFVPGVVERLGLDYAAARAVNPSIIYLSSCNMGQTGPKASQRGFGSQLTSGSGFTHFAGYPGGKPMLLYGPYIDFIAVGFGLVAVMAALDYRQRTGAGQYIDLAQYECGLQYIAPALLDLQANNRVMTRDGNRDPNAAPHNAYPCQGDDAWCVIAVFGDDEWRDFCRATGHLDWLSDARFRTHDARKLNEDELDRAVSEWTQQFMPREVMETLQSAGVRAGIVNRLGDLFCDAQLKHREVWRELPHAVLERFYYLAPPYNLSETRAELKPSPLLGEHNRYVFGELLGMSEREMRELMEQGVIE